MQVLELNIRKPIQASGLTKKLTGEEVEKKESLSDGCME